MVKKMTVKKFRSNRMDSFCENQKSRKWLFLATFGLILAMFLTSQSYDFDAFAHAGAPLGED